MMGDVRGVLPKAMPRESTVAAESSLDDQANTSEVTSLSEPSGKVANIRIWRCAPAGMLPLFTAPLMLMTDGPGVGAGLGVGAGAGGGMVMGGPPPLSPGGWGATGFPPHALMLRETPSVRAATAARPKRIFKRMASLLCEVCLRLYDVSPSICLIPLYSFLLEKSSPNLLIKLCIKCALFYKNRAPRVREGPGGN